MKTLGALRRLTADLPDETPLGVPAYDYSYRYPGVEVTTAIAHICACPAPFELDCGDDPEIYGHFTVEQVRKARHRVIVIT